MVSIEMCEDELKTLETVFSRVDHYLEGKLSIKRSEVSGVETRARRVIDICTAHTLEFGHSARADRVKDRAFEMLGRIIGEDI